MTHLVRFAAEAADQLEDLQAYISRAASPDIAARYVDAIVEYCEGLGVFPHRGLARDDLRPGLRTVSYRKRAVVAFTADDTTEMVTFWASSTAVRITSQH